MKLERESVKIERQVSLKNRKGYKDSEGFLLNIRAVGLVCTGFKFINPQPNPKFQFLKAQDLNPTYHAIWAHPLGLGLGGSSWFGWVTRPVGQP